MDDSDSPHSTVDRLMSELDRIVVVEDARLPLQPLQDVPPAAARAVITDARIELAALRGAAAALEELAMSCVDVGDDVAAKACLEAGQRLQEGADFAQATLDDLIAQYGSLAGETVPVAPRSQRD